MASCNTHALALLAALPAFAAQAVRKAYDATPEGAWAVARARATGFHLEAGVEGEVNMTVSSGQTLDAEGITYLGSRFPDMLEALLAEECAIAQPLEIGTAA